MHDVPIRALLLTPENEGTFKFEIQVTRGNQKDSIVFPLCYKLSGFYLGILASKEVLSSVKEMAFFADREALGSAIPLSAKNYQISFSGGSSLVIISEPFFTITGEL